MRTVFILLVAALVGHSHASSGQDGASPQSAPSLNDGCVDPCIEIGLIERLWDVTDRMTEEVVVAFTNDLGMPFRLSTHPTIRAQRMMARGEFDILFYYEGEGAPGAVITRNRLFDVYAAAVGLKENRRLAELPSNADQLTIATIRGDDLFRYFAKRPKMVPAEHLAQAFFMLDRGRVDAITEYAMQTDMGLLVPYFDPKLYRAVKLAGPLYGKPMFLDTKRGRMLRDAMDRWIWRAHQEGSLYPIYERHGIAPTYPAEFQNPDGADAPDKAAGQ